MSALHQWFVYGALAVSVSSVAGLAALVAWSTGLWPPRRRGGKR